MSAKDVTAARTAGRLLRPSEKVLPEHARVHNRALVLQTLYGSGRQSRADVARSTGLTRVTVSDLVAELMADGLVVELGPRETPPSESVQRGKPAILLDIDRASFNIIGIDLGGHSVFRGAVLDLAGTVLHESELPLPNGVPEGGAAAIERSFALVEGLIGAVSAPILGIGVGSPGIVDASGTVLSAPNLGWQHEPLQARLAEQFSLPVAVMNDANAAVLAEHSFGEARGDLMVVTVGQGVGSGLVLGGGQLFGSHHAAGEIGHVVVDPDGEPCRCGKSGCLETWLAIPRLQAKLEVSATSAARDEVLREAGRRLGIALAPIVGVLDLDEIVLSGPASYLDGALIEAADATLRARTMAAFSGQLTLRMSTLGDDIVLRGAAAAVLSRQLGFS
ncbi:ROK family transcriptional regulator [Parafrigoribacterium soli]|uniref:ROK family transcriptional regulator n=1 Tax=Parafrigoribacterium soli TaxID=3144663 RepID=UPI0032EB2936